MKAKCCPHQVEKVDLQWGTVTYEMVGMVKNHYWEEVDVEHSKVVEMVSCQSRIQTKANLSYMVIPGVTETYA